MAQHLHEPIPLVTTGSLMTSNWANSVADAVNQRDDRVARLERALEIVLKHLPPEVRMEVDVLVEFE